MRRHYLIAAALLLGGCATYAARAVYDGLSTSEQTCVAEVVDGDSIRCDGELIRIAGIDAPETNPAQTCYRRLGLGDIDRELALGEAAADALDELLADAGYLVRITDVDYDDDRWGRPIAIVWADEVVVAEWMVARGHAAPYAGEQRTAWCGA